MKFAVDRPYADPEKAARKLIEIANSIEPGRDGRSEFTKLLANREEIPEIVIRSRNVTEWNRSGYRNCGSRSDTRAGAHPIPLFQSRFIISSRSARPHAPAGPL